VEKDTIIRKLTENLLTQACFDENSNEKAKENIEVLSKKIYACACDGAGNTNKKNEILFVS
jgi:hypothetical protein